MAMKRNALNRLRDIVRAAGVRAVATKTGIDASQLSRWINGQRDLKTEQLEDVAKAVGYRLELVQSGQRLTGLEASSSAS